uniref:FP protein C-terminal domain-containing protein n=1 Tax=Cacopsylla melanoneura TaxID=428564 RepID=A0A8D8VPK4_9HEMI
MACLFLTLFLVSIIYPLRAQESQQTTVNNASWKLENNTSEHTTQYFMTNSKLVDSEFDGEQRTRLNNIIVHNYPQLENENPLDVAAEVGREMGLMYPQDDIALARRISMKAKVGRPSPLVVRLKDRKARIRWTTQFRKRKLHQAKQWILTEHLSSYNRELLRQAREWARNNGWKYCWSQDCRVLLREVESGNVVRVKKLEDLQKLKPGVSNNTV